MGSCIYQQLVYDFWSRIYNVRPLGTSVVGGKLLRIGGSLHAQ